MLVSEKPLLGEWVGFAGHVGRNSVRNTSGAVSICQRVRVQFRMLRDDDLSWGKWIAE